MLWLLPTPPVHFSSPRMTRPRNTTVDGTPFSDAVVEAVWAQGYVLGKYDPDVWRLDTYGYAMRRSAYGDARNEHGWEIDHVVPVALGGTDDLANLQPLQWHNNLRKGDRLPWQHTHTPNAL